ncbi:hypothetical protein HanXRQr2_Chr13g0613811 [Helianthus annuus]|uniref:Uncharacterized protein n=1 Tax=Helianthus annuus TaxID=4232 RepID=A0A9K3ELP1_HELAN|nr:hypothetical protein HanXRQr2_Chr13g0613811 [Helianthus annuus]KAJ0478691.1 hypothetical protein HanHA300_Chr13g0502791 [Helianthus annuus]KAJ0665585.1 hypothetical protein HanLR1_Chr13g0505501 [Helianthus annuus]KAJ0673032.1 hypothetical protein HanOQP8_Chr13g0503721 [Helianthus annuus]
MREHDIAHIVETILDAPENATSVDEMNERARQAGFKVGYKKCISDVTPFVTSRLTDERSGFHGVEIPKLLTSLRWMHTTNCPFPPLMILRNVWRWKITWIVCACCLTHRRRMKALVVRRMMQTLVV